MTTDEALGESDSDAEAANAIPLTNGTSVSVATIEAEKVFRNRFIVFLLPAFLITYHNY